VQKDRVILKAAPKYASQNIIIFANREEIFTGSLSRKSEINLSLSNKEGRRILKEYDRNKEIYALIK
jgi:predicted PilT family ATPase